MTLELESTIKHCEEVAEYMENKEGYAFTDITYAECASEHRQLAEWLKKLKAYEDAREELERKINSGQWSDAVRYGMFKALYIQKKHLGEVNADGKPN